MSHAVSSRQQSPISINPADLYRKNPVNPEFIKILDGGKPWSMDWESNEKSFVIDAFKDLSQPGYGIALHGKLYTFSSFHFHAHSEHIVGLEHDVGECHFVFKPEGGGSMAVVSRMITSLDGKPDQQKDSFLDFLANAFQQQQLAREGKVAINSSESLWKMVLSGAFNKTFIHYEGTATTGDVSRHVDWLIFDEPINLSLFAKETLSGSSNIWSKAIPCFPKQDSLTINYYSLL